MQLTLVVCIELAALGVQAILDFLQSRVFYRGELHELEEQILMPRNVRKLRRDRHNDLLKRTLRARFDLLAFLEESQDGRKQVHLGLEH